MKHFISLLFVAFAAIAAKAEIVETYNAPTQLQAFYIDGQTTLWFVAPTDGGIVWKSDFSYATGLGDMRQIGDGDAWANAGGGGEISTSAAIGAAFTNHAGSLATPAVHLDAATSYRLSYKSAGSRSSANQKLSIELYRNGAPVKTVLEAYELSPSLNYETKEAVFSVDESADDYEVRFVFTASEKNCGASLMTIVLEAPIPEGRGSLLGYNVYRDGNKERFYNATDAVLNQLYYELVDDTALDYSTTYTYALQAVYEGGESPLSNTATITTPDDPLVGISSTVLRSRRSATYSIDGRSTASPRGITIDSKGRKTLAY